ncbi:MAG: DUF262 domain-containing protein [Rhodospirillales bacterium]|nr:DUF262 domain-containing protein [Rhodospirillales bacterium]
MAQDDYLTENDDDFEEVRLSKGQIDEGDLVNISAANIQHMLVSPTDWTIGVLVDLLKRKKIDLQPHYQRRIAWTELKMSRFIESLFLRLPVPQVVLAETSPGRFAVIDGKQRVNSIARFCLDTENPLRLQKCEYRHDLNGMTFQEMERDESHEASLDAFQSHTIRTTVIKNWGTDELLYLLFLRLNQNSVTLSPQELRRALFPGEFMNWLDDKTTNSKGMKFIFTNTPDFRMRDMEVATRHLAFRFYSDKYLGNMKQFLDYATDALRKKMKENTQELELEWLKYEAAIDVTREIFQGDAFRLRVNNSYQHTKNRAVMDIMTFFFANDDTRKLAQKNKVKVKLAFENLCDNDQKFMRYIQASTKTLPATAYRFQTWRQTLCNVFNVNIPKFSLEYAGEG